MTNKIITVFFSTNGVPQTGLTPTIDIFLLDPLFPAINTLVVNDGASVEIGEGWYRYDFATYDPYSNYVFIFDGGATLSDCDRYKVGGNDSFVEDISSGVWDEPAASHLTIGTTGFVLSAIKSDTTTIIISVAAATALIQTLLKYERNRTRIDTGAMTLTVYDDDCVTPLTVFDLKDSAGAPSVLEVCERKPLGC